MNSNFFLDNFIEYILYKYTKFQHEDSFLFGASVAVETPCGIVLQAKDWDMSSPIITMRLEGVIVTCIKHSPQFIEQLNAFLKLLRTTQRNIIHVRLTRNDSLMKAILLFPSLNHHHHSCSFGISRHKCSNLKPCQYTQKYTL